MTSITVISLSTMMSEKTMYVMLWNFMSLCVFCIWYMNFEIYLDGDILDIKTNLRSFHLVELWSSRFMLNLKIINCVMKFQWIFKDSYICITELNEIFDDFVILQGDPFESVTFKQQLVYRFYKVFGVILKCFF